MMHEEPTLCFEEVTATIPVFDGLKRLGQGARDASQSMSGQHGATKHLLEIMRSIK